MADPIDHSHTHISEPRSTRVRSLTFFWVWDLCRPKHQCDELLQDSCLQQLYCNFFFGVGEHNLDNTTKGKLESIFFCVTTQEQSALTYLSLSLMPRWSFTIRRVAGLPAFRFWAMTPPTSKTKGRKLMVPWQWRAWTGSHKPVDVLTWTAAVHVRFSKSTSSILTTAPITP